MKTRIYLFRHGETDWNKERRIQGHIDIPLNDRGREQARALARHIERLGVQSIVSSDLSRALETATLASGRSTLVRSDQRLREIHLGKLQGLTREEMKGLLTPEQEAMLNDQPLSDADIVNLGGETGLQVYTRALEAMLEHLKLTGHTTIGVSTHGGVARRLLERALGYFPPSTPNSVLYPLVLKLDHGLEAEIQIEPSLPL